jgi:hypothetical protein
MGSATPDTGRNPPISPIFSSSVEVVVSDKIALRDMSYDCFDGTAIAFIQFEYFMNFG